MDNSELKGHMLDRAFPSYRMDKEEGVSDERGISKIGYYAGIALQGLLAADNRRAEQLTIGSMQLLANRSVNLAEQLILALDQKVNKEKKDA